MIKEHDLQLVTDKTQKTLFSHLDLNTFLRLNPHLEIVTFEEEGDSYKLSMRDYETEEEDDFVGTYTWDNSSALLTFDHGIVKSISIFIKDNKLTGEIDYNLEEEPTEEQLKLPILWLRSIREYIRIYQKNSLYNIFFRIIMNKMILTMTPSQRKISLMLYRLTLLEMVAILICVVGWFIFVR